jgi:hypothetical protein
MPPPPPRATFAGLVDDAAMFPPGNASAADALAGHLALRACADADLVGPLLVPARAWAAFVDAVGAAGRPPVTVILIGTTTLPDDVPEEVSIAGFELRVADVPLPEVPAGASLATEIALGAGAGRVLAAVARAAADDERVVAKFRTGGTTAEAFPSEEVVATVISDAVAVGAPLKFTAGLHHAVRFTDETTGFEHHGFLNLLVATARAARGADLAPLVEVLQERRPESLVAMFRELDDRDLDSARRGFVSFGCCGVEDPIRDLAALGLIADGVSP